MVVVIKFCVFCINVETARRRTVRWIVYPACTNTVPRPRTWWTRRTTVPKSILKFFWRQFFSHNGPLQKMNVMVGKRLAINAKTTHIWTHEIARWNFVLGWFVHFVVFKRSDKSVKRCPKQMKSVFSSVFVSNKRIKQCHNMNRLIRQHECWKGRHW